jgi:hypothetical protein
VDKLVGASFVSKLLSNPIYYGHFKWKGEVCEGSHDPIVSKELFDAVQKIIDRRWKWSPDEQSVKAKPFLGLLHCAECGGAITAEMQKGHTYYRCTKKNKIVRKCAQPYVREELLDAEISRLLSPFALRAEFANGLIALADADARKNTETAAIQSDKMRLEIDKITGRSGRLQDAFLDGVIERDEFVLEKAKLMSSRKTLEEQRAALTRYPNRCLEPFKNWVFTAQNAGAIARTGSLAEKKALAEKVFGSNLFLDCKKASGRAIKPWSILVDNESFFPNWWSLLTIVRTFFDENPTL